MSVDIIDALEVVRDIQERMNAPSLRDQRNAGVVAARDAGWTYQDIATALGRSREWVRQIDKKTRAKTT